MATKGGAGLLLLVFFSAIFLSYGRYEPNWKSLDTRPLPAWYDDVKFGIFMHWGVFSVPSFSSEWFWNSWHKGNKACVEFMKKNYPPDFTYADFGPMFKAEFYDPNEWADLLKASGAKYVVLTSKHHEGYTMWPSKYSWNWNAGDVGPKRDLLGDLATAIRNRTDIHFGLYHSMFEWFNPLYLQDKANHFKTQDFVRSKTMPELYEIVNKYKPEVIWSDGDWEVGPSYWNSTSFLAWLYNDSPVKDTVVVNDRWGAGVACHHGGYYTCQDKYQPGHLIKHKWENCMTVDRHSWGYRREAKVADILTIEELVATLVETVSCGGNLLMNVGPTSDGRIVPVFEERLRGMGSWLKVNGEAIYGSKPWANQKDNITKNLWYTSKPSADGSTVYAIALRWPQTNVLSLSAPKPTANTKVSLLGYATPLKWRARPEGGIDIIIPNIPTEQIPCQWGWTFKLEGM